MCAITMSGGNSARKLSISVVLPDPMSPVITTKPAASQIVASMYAFARECCLLANRNCGSGVRRNGGSLSWNNSQYMAGDGAPKTVGAKPNTKDAVFREAESPFRGRDQCL